MIEKLDESVSEIGKYIVSNIEFDSKEKIKKKIREIEKKYLDFQPLEENDFKFMLGVFKNHSSFKSKTNGMTGMYFAPSKEYPSTRCVYIAYGNKNTDIKDRPSDDISWTFCVNRIKKKKTKCIRFNFGKYKGKTIQDVFQFNRDYLYWVAGETFKDSKIKQEVIKFLKMKPNTIEETMNNINNNQLNNTEFEFINPNKKEKITNRKDYPVDIAVYDIRGHYITKYNRPSDGEKDGFKPNHISNCVKGHQKIHDNCIFIGIEKGSTPKQKIDTSEYIHKKNSIAYKNIMIVKSISTPKQSKNDTLSTINQTQYTITNKDKIRIGQFDKQYVLVDVFTTFKKLKSKFSNTSGVYDHYFDRIVKSKSKESGYHGFYFKQLNIGETYIIGEKYDFSSFQKPISKFNKLIEVEHSPIVDTIDVKIPENKLLSENLLNVVDFNTIKVEDIFPSATVEIPNNTPTYQESTKENIIKRIQYGIRYILTGKK